MKKILSLFLLATAALSAQTIPNAVAYQLPVTAVMQKWYGSGAPTAALNFPVQPCDFYFDTTAHNVYQCAAPMSAFISTYSGGPAACSTVGVGGWTLIYGSAGFVSGPAPVPCGATCAATPGQLVLLNLAAGSTVTIPTSSGSGNVIRMRVTVATTSAQEKVLLATTTDAIIGTAIGENAGTGKIFVGNASTYHSIQMPFAGTQPSGGFIGDSITCTDIATGTWACDVVFQAGVTPTTPYSAATT